MDDVAWIYAHYVCQIPSLLLDIDSMLWFCLASAVLQQSSPLLTPIPLYVPNPLSPPAADKEECIAAFTLRSTGR